MKFYNDGAVNFPYLSDGMWFLTQHKRWGLLKEDPDYLAVAQKVNQIEVVQAGGGAGQGAGAEGIVPHVEADRRHGMGRQEPEGLRRRFQDQGGKWRSGDGPPGARLRTLPQAAQRRQCAPASVAPMRPRRYCAASAPAQCALTPIRPVDGAAASARSRSPIDAMRFAPNAAPRSEARRLAPAGSAATDRASPCCRRCSASPLFIGDLDA